MFSNVFSRSFDYESEDDKLPDDIQERWMGKQDTEVNGTMFLNGICLNRKQWLVVKLVMHNHS